MNSMRGLVSAIAMVLSAVTATSASATTFIYDVDADSESFVFGNSKDYFKGLTDHFLFDTTQSGYVSAFVGSFALSPTLDVVLKSVLFDDKPITKVSTGAQELWTLDQTPVGVGRHTIKVSGYYGQKGGAYAGTFNFSTSALPEPATWAMMIIGFGMAGAAMRRRPKVSIAYS